MRKQRSTSTALGLINGQTSFAGLLISQHPHGEELDRQLGSHSKETTAASPTSTGHLGIRLLSPPLEPIGKPQCNADEPSVGGCRGWRTKSQPSLRARSHGRRPRTCLCAPGQAEAFIEHPLSEDPEFLLRLCSGCLLPLEKEHISR